MTPTLRQQVISGHGRPYTYFGTPTNLPNTLAGLKRVQAGGGKFRIVLYGDSRTSDYGCGTGGTTYIDAVNRGPQAKMAARFVEYGYTCNLNSAIGTRGVISAANVTAYDSRMVLTNGTIANLAFGGLLFVLDTSGEKLAVTLTGDTIEVPYIRLAGGGTFTYNIDGGAESSAVNQGSGTTAAIIGPLSVGAGSHTITFSWASGIAFLSGALAYDSGASEIEIINGGIGGATMGQLDTTTNSGPKNFAAALSADLYIMVAGSNDTDLVAFLASAESTMRTHKAAGKDVIFVVPGKNSSSYQNIAPGIRRNLIPICGRYGVPLIDLWSISEPYAAAEFYDTVHENELRVAKLYPRIVDEIMRMVRLA